LAVLQAASWLPRTEGSLRLALARRADGSGDRTGVDVLHEQGAARVRFPRPAPLGPAEAVLLNTAGGLTGGDKLAIEVSLGEGARAVVTTAAAEKIYRASHGKARISVALAVAGGELAWLPQPTILFDRARLERMTTIKLRSDASILAVEMLIFGRAAMGESVVDGSVHDALRVWRDDVLLFADSFRLEGEIAAALARPAVLAGARATGLLIYVAPAAERRIAEARALLANAAGVVGVSGYNEMLVVRAAAADGRTLKADLAPLIEALHGRALPRIWTC
jgi:urease accessory protein